MHRATPFTLGSPPRRALAAPRLRVLTAPSPPPPPRLEDDNAFEAPGLPTRAPRAPRCSAQGVKGTRRPLERLKRKGKPCTSRNQYWKFQVSPAVIAPVGSIVLMSSIG